MMLQRGKILARGLFSPVKQPAMKITAQVRFNRRELSGAFGDIGTDFPLILGILRVVALNPATVFIVFGSLQIFTGIVYGIPMAVQPLKAMAVIVITQKLPAETLLGAGLGIGVSMLILAGTGVLNWLVRIVPHAVLRGIQLGLGLQLAKIALTDYVGSEKTIGYLLAAFASVLIYALRNNPRFPVTVVILLGGIVWGLLAHRLTGESPFVSEKLPAGGPGIPSMANIMAGFWALVIPQLPLSLANSVLATERLANDLFPEKKISVRKIGITYGLMNVFAAIMGGIPVCHGCGGMAGMHFFGGRTGGAPVIYGLFYVLIGTLFAGALGSVVNLFPLPLLGSILLFEAVALMLQTADIVSHRPSFFLCLLCAVVSAYLPNGYVVALVAGTLLYWVLDRRQHFTGSSEENPRCCA